MPTISLTWPSSKELPCGGSTPSEIIIVVPSSKLAQRNCPIQPVALPEITAQTSFSYGTLDAVLVSSYEQFSSCGKTFTYTAEIDSDQVAAGQTILIEDILGVTCKGAWAKWVADQVGQEIKVLTIPGPPAQLAIVSQHGCIYVLDAVTGGNLVSGFWGVGALNLPDCNIDSGQLIYLNSAGRLMAEPSKNYIIPVRIDGGAYDSGLGVVPAADLPSPTPLLYNFQNTQCRPISFLPFFEFPSVVFDAGAANDWALDMFITGTNPDDAPWGTTNSARFARFNFPAAGGNIIFPPGMSTFPGPTILNPGSILTVGATWVFRRIVYNANGNNRVQIFGPRLSFAAHTI
jgi:hypothetical protein